MINKDEIVVKLIRSVWSSLDSHLDYTTVNVKNQYMGDRKQQKRFVKEYIEQLNNLSKLL